MKFLPRIIFIIIAFLAPVAAQQKRLPRFKDYSVRENYRGKIAPVRLIDHLARNYRTMLRLNAREGANFAGHYIVATWGCGSDCHSFAIIDAKTGNVYFSDLISFVGGQLYQEEDRLQFQKNSRLLIVAGAKMIRKLVSFIMSGKIIGFA